jgi:ArsR family transcriptional regulator
VAGGQRSGVLASPPAWKGAITTHFLAGAFQKEGRITECKQSRTLSLARKYYSCLIYAYAYVHVVKLLTIYKCLCDETRLRILSLLSESSLCVCHIQKLLGKSQVIVSQHLAYLRGHGMVAGQRYQHWMIYSLPASRSAELEANLKCLQDCVQTEAIFKKDRAKLKKLMATRSARNLLDEGCCARPGENSRRGKVSRKSTEI